jgi:hypothetical protein
MIVLNKIAVRYWKISEKQKRVNWCTSKMAILCNISTIWRNLCKSNRSARPDERYRDVEIQVVDIMLELLNLLTLIGCNDIEGVIKHRIDQKEGKEMPNEKTEIDNPDT